MIVGKGLIANSFLNDSLSDVLIFASGVSNSKEEDQSEFQRERDLLIDTISNNRKKKVIYFSTCDFYDSRKSSKYLNHKFEMESLIKERCENWIIFRVSQIIGSGNINNLLFSFILKVKNNTRINLFRNFERNMITISDVRCIVMNYIKISNREIINIANPKNIKVHEIVSIIEKNLNKNAIVEESQEENFFKIPLREDYPFEKFTSKYYEESIKDFIRNIIY